jgi:hypothetical protein
MYAHSRSHGPTLYTADAAAQEEAYDRRCLGDSPHKFTSEASSCEQSKTYVLFCDMMIMNQMSQATAAVGGENVKAQQERTLERKSMSKPLSTPPSQQAGPSRLPTGHSENGDEESQRFTRVSLATTWRTHDAMFRMEEGNGENSR